MSQSDVHFLVMGILERKGLEFDPPLYALKRESILDSLIIEKTNSQIFQQIQILRENEDFLNHMNRLKDMKPAPQIKMTTGTTGHGKQYFEEKRTLRKGIWALL